MTTSARLPTTVIGGYLGAGKTTLINALLHQAQPVGARLAVLVNDFGDIAIDAALIESADTNVMQLAGGCVCCTIGNDLLSTIADLRMTVGDVDHVLVETSGVALPGTVAATIGIAPPLLLNGTLVLVDAVNLYKQLGNRYIGDTIERQLAAADLILCTKTDLVEPPALQQLLKKLAADYPGTPCMPASQGQLPIQLVLDAGLGQSTVPGSTNKTMRTGLLRAGPLGRPDKHLDKIRAQAFEAPEVCDVNALQALLRQHGDTVVRSKGFVKDSSGNTLIVQSVVGRIDVSDPADPRDDGHTFVAIAAGEPADMQNFCHQIEQLGFVPLP